MYVAKILIRIALELAKLNASAIIVGGAVRDNFLKLPIKDYDIEVYGLESLEQLESVLIPYGSVNLVGKSFGVLKFTDEGEEYDFSFPRRESKVAKGHRGFDVEVNGSLDFTTAARRRDFTINAIGYDIEKKVFIDPFNGLEDIKNKKLRYIDDETFIEDPLRVYRAVQFSARFGFELSGDTFKLCRQMVTKGMLDELPKERVYTEWKKLLLQSKHPSIGFELMRKLGILERYFPELHALIGVPQSPKWHPEGDVWIHTMMALDAMYQELRIRNEELGISEKQKLKFLFAILCHDLGKASTTTIDEEGGIRAIGHEKAGLELTKSLMYRLTDEHDFVETLLPLVEHHLKPSQFYAAQSKASAIRRLATKVNIEELVMVAKADFLGRTTEEALTGEYKAGKWLLEKASELNVKTKPIEPLILGRDLIALGLEPSPQFREILDEVYGLQIEGIIVDREDALHYLKNKYNGGTL
jgi:tRNA nucleotidyltransferase (CCA-adding enzyme)